MNTTCIMCPVGCQLNIEKKGNEIIVTGNSCIRGKQYGISEFTAPSRIVTALVKTQKGVLPVKTTGLIPKDRIKDCLEEIGKIELKKGKSGDKVIKNLFGLNVDVVITGDYRI